MSGRHDFAHEDDAPRPKVQFGDEVFFEGGEYVGKYGWMNDARMQISERYYYVIVQMKGYKRFTHVSRRFVVPRPQPPSNYVEAIFYQKADVSRKLSQLCYMLAKCKMKSEDVDNFGRIFAPRLDRAIADMRRLGEKAEYREVDFDRYLEANNMVDLTDDLSEG